MNCLCLQLLHTEFCERKWWWWRYFRPLVRKDTNTELVQKACAVLTSPRESLGFGHVQFRLWIGDKTGMSFRFSFQIPMDCWSSGDHWFRLHGTICVESLSYAGNQFWNTLFKDGKKHQPKLLLLIEGCIKQNVILTKLLSRVLQRRAKSS